jgi:DNA-binding MarR family transcriptional regulator
MLGVREGAFAGEVSAGDRSGTRAGPAAKDCRLGRRVSSMVPEAGMNLPTLSIKPDPPSDTRPDPPSDTREGFAMVPRRVVSDPRLKHLDVRVYAVMALYRRGALVNMGTRLIAKHACSRRQNVAKSIKRLAAYGHIESMPHKNFGRATYHLLAERFNRAAGGEKAEDARAEESGGTEIIPLRCPRCKNRVRQVLKAGHCRSCAWVDRVKGLAREVVMESA